MLRDLWIDGHKGHTEFVIPYPTDFGQLNGQTSVGIVRMQLLAAAYSAEVATSATKAGSCGVFGERE